MHKIDTYWATPLETLKEDTATIEALPKRITKLKKQYKKK